MTTAMHSAASSQPADADMRHAVAELFSVFQRCYGTRWRATFDDPKARPTWFAVFNRAGLDASAVRLGMARAASLAWPPTCGEFIELCKPDSPSIDAAIIEAVRWANGQVFSWSHPAIGAAAKAIGAWAIRSSDGADLRYRLGRAYDSALLRHSRGEPLDVPQMLALPKTVHASIPHGASPPVVTSAIREAAAFLGVSLSAPPFRPSALPPESSEGAGAA